jgi:hypothetical protein
MYVCMCVCVREEGGGRDVEKELESKVEQGKILSEMRQ